MNRLTAAAIALAISTVAAGAQEAFTGDCKAAGKAGKDACVATQWCQWVQPKPVVLPDGRSVEIPGSCAFKKHHKTAWEAVKAGKQ